MKISDAGLNLIKKYEGLRLEAYKCPSGIWTIGYGHTNGVTQGMKISHEQADIFLRQDVANSEKYVNQYDAIYHFTQNQYDALVSFTYNCGAGNLKKLVYGGQRTIAEISNAIPNYNKGGGKVLNGLVKRRADEKAMFDKGTPKKSVSDVVAEVIDSKWGNGNDRRQRLTKAGYDYQVIQAEVNKVMSAKAKTSIKDTIIKRALAEIGTCENPANSNRVKYNTWFYGHEVSGAEYKWCAVFISWLFRDHQDLCVKSASCQQMLEWFEAHNLIVHTPQAGDIVFFKYSTNNRKTNHVGLVIDVKEKNIVTIEGNTSQSSNDNGGKVMKRTRSKNIVGYARPKY